MTSISFPSYPIIDIKGNDLTDMIINQKFQLDNSSNFIGDDNKCTICGKTLKKRIHKIKNEDSDLEEIQIITSHKHCKKLMTKINSLKELLLNYEFELFCLKK